MTNNTASALSNAIAARIDAEFNVHLLVRDQVIADLTTIARARKASAKKLTVSLIEGVILTHAPEVERITHTNDHIHGITDLHCSLCVAEAKAAKFDAHLVSEAPLTVSKRVKKGKVCSDCNVKITKRNTCIGMGVDDLCAYCYDAAATENEHTDTGHDGETVDGCRECGTYDPAAYYAPKAKNTTGAKQSHTSHKDCAHESSPKARAACRKARAAAQA
jgi:hypothetical protein